MTTQILYPSNTLYPANDLYPGTIDVGDPTPRTPRPPGKATGIVLSEGLTGGFPRESVRGGIVKYDERRTNGVADRDGVRTGGQDRDRLTGGINLNED